MIIRALRGLLVLAVLLTSNVSAEEGRLRPFLLADSAYESFDAAVEQTYDRLMDAGFLIVGNYRPVPGTEIVVFTSNELQAVATQTPLGGFGAVLRAAVTDVDGKIQVSYINPHYMAAAYRLEGDIGPIAATLEEYLGATESFGSKKGLKEKSLASYRYLFGMERFDDTYALGTFVNQSEALATVAARLADNDAGLSQVYRVRLPARQGVLFGVAMQPDGDANKYYNDAYQMSVVDVAELRGSAYLPYEVLVKDGEVQALHMRFRMAVHFPDLSMMGKHSFMTLMPSPDAIKDALETLAQ